MRQFLVSLKKTPMILVVVLVFVIYGFSALGAPAEVNEFAIVTSIGLDRLEDESEGKYEVSVAPIESRNFIGQKIVFSPATAFVEVLPPVCIGDLDGDGEISDWDSIIFNRYLAGWDVEIINDAADIDGDGEVSDWDAILLDRYLAGWDVTIG